MLNRIRMYWHLAWGLREFLREPITLEQSRQIIRQRLANRENNFLAMARRAIYENKNSPYRKLLEIVGCEYEDLERMVQSDGIESCLRKLADEGVCLSIEEFKCMKEVSRGGKIFNFKESDFDNPYLVRSLENSSSGSRSRAARTFYDLDYLALGRAIYTIYLLDAYDALDIPIVIWRPIMPSSGPPQILQHAKAGKPPAKWFSPVDNKGFKPSLKHRFGTNYMVYMGRFCGSELPAPEYVGINEAWRVAEWVADAIKLYGGCYIHTSPSKAVFICQSAKERGLNISGAKFAIGGEPITETKRWEIESTGGTVNPRYVITECGYIGLGCFNPVAPDDVHFFKDSLAIIQHRKQVANSDNSLDAFLFTSLLLGAPKVLLNVESGDYGTVERRHCGCKFEEIGFTDHIYNIRSYDKLTSQGVTFFGTQLIKLVEEILPQKFGGASVDYQMLEEEDERGQTRMSIVIRPEVGKIDETELIKTVLTELSKTDDSNRLMAELWNRAKTLQVKRMPPLTTGGSKILPLHTLKVR